MERKIATMSEFYFIYSCVAFIWCKLIQFDPFLFISLVYVSFSDLLIFKMATTKDTQQSKPIDEIFTSVFPISQSNTEQIPPPINYSRCIMFCLS